ncbi:DRTGG domain-containing protein [Desulfomonile tiedjei]|uniref:DRTGG domain-containing protein n=1 Tax=Desulfomonile tiedjei (strain ATCC 49306 / DSM 6799 / DCB-1) TaxID=706587 RepID=I4C783_DESTA|nr:DRTGG domain-containing protein [Desulfomonile tiedjei]AFM25424.1 DRTGG domain-containing protein [Desulfomonile tiedjei DSM 6799]
MTLGSIAEALNLSTKTCRSELNREVEGGYVSDLLSDVIAGAREGDLWITLQLHQNIVAVASLNNLAGIVIVGGREPDSDTLKKAEEQSIPLLVTNMTAYELAGRLYEMGIRRQAS